MKGKQLAAGLALLAAMTAGVTLELGGPVRIIAGLVVVLLPGIALGWLLLAGALQLNRQEQWIWSAAGSLATCAGGAFLLNVTGGLTRTSWISLLTGVTLVECAAGAALSSSSRRVGQPGRSIHRPGRTGISLRSRGLRAGLCAVLALAAAAAAVTLSVRSDLGRPTPAFTQLWMVPVVAARSSTGTAQLGVADDQPGQTRFKLVVTSGGRQLRAWTFELNRGGSWTDNIPVATGQELAAALYVSLGGQWSVTPYRQVHSVAGAQWVAPG